jgi:hypothetical protein
VSKDVCNNDRLRQLGYWQHPRIATSFSTATFLFI